MSQSKSIIGNILLSGYLHEHEEIVNTQIPDIIRSVISVYIKQYTIRTIGTSPSTQPISHQTIDLTSSLRDKSYEYNVFRTNSNTANTYPCATNQPHPSHNTEVVRKMDSIFQNSEDELVDIQIGGEHTLILTASGIVYAYGSNDSGQCGLGEDIMFVGNPTQIPFDCKIKSISCGKVHSLFINTDGRLLVCGYNYCGQLGIQTSDANAENVAYSSSEDDLFDDSDSDESDSEFEYEENRSIFKPIYNEYFSDVRFNHISCGEFHSLCLTTTGECYTFGHDGFGNLGNGMCTEWGEGISVPYKVEINKRFISASSGRNHNILLTDNNEIVVFGDNQCNQCSSIDEQKIEKPLILSKEKEFSIAENCYVEKVMCVNDESIVAIDIYKRV